MNGHVGPRLAALVADLAHPGRLARLPQESSARRPVTARSRVEVTVVTGAPGVGTAAAPALADLERAGLFRAVAHRTATTGLVLLADVEALAAVPGVVEVERSALRRTALHSSVPATKADLVRATPGRDGAGVVVGIVDTGIDLFHHAFRNSDGSSRVVALWDQTSPTRVTVTGTPSGGTFTLSWQAPGHDAQTTATLPHTATAAQVRTALADLDHLDAEDLQVSGGPLPGTPVEIRFVGRYLHQDVEPIEVDDDDLVPTATTRVVMAHGRRYDLPEIAAIVAGAEADAPTWDADGHGTHVAGIAAGDGSQAGNCHGAGYYVGVAPAADLVVVKRGPGAGESMSAVAWVLDRAADQPCVVNLSYGGVASAHDGSDPEDVEYDTMMAARPPGRVIVASAGNEGARGDPDDVHTHRWAGLHSRKPVAAHGEVELTAQVRPRDTASDWFYVWYGEAMRLSLVLQEPGGDSTTAVDPGDTFDDELARHHVWIRNRTNASTTGRHTIAIRIDPREGGTVARGEWVLRLSELAGHAGDVDCWIDPTDEPNPRFVLADQDAGFTIGSPGSSHGVITVASYDHRTSTLAVTSSKGPTIDPRPAGETKPDLVAPGVGIIAARAGYRGGICCDCCYDFYVAKSGTSMAAPHVTGVVALMLAAEPTLTWDVVRRRLREGAVPPDPITGPTLPDASWGAGVLDAQRAVGGPAVDVRAGPAPSVATELRVHAAAATGRLAELRERALATPDGRQLAALLSAHVDEVQRLVGTRRRVTVAWHRMRGPALLRVLAEGDPGVGPLVPTDVEGTDVRAGLARLLDELEAEGSLPLRADLVRHRALLLGLPGRDLLALEAATG